MTYLGNHYEFTLSNSQVNRLRHFVRAGLRSLFRPEPQTAVEWADANYYLPKESA
ncbi:TPA: hypothetical protein ACNCIJ_004848, partial [Escherichia coli]